MNVNRILTPQVRAAIIALALAQPDILDIPPSYRWGQGAAKEYIGPHRIRRRMKGKKQ